ncbi:13662_t:CDS:1 [Funneliformis caledonium]|uniref:13662_t:CDS:1 n=1 Tax=Funneliformis caledonium TaxID=1117310 RepID=A0A9N9HP04_9GLOM|nr:13662_t:CDS:1 [Funneliformis caledonium]
MNNLLFTALLIALLYYFFYYLPNQKKPTANLPLKHHQSTQTEELEESINHHEPGMIEFPSPQFKIAPKELANLKKDIQQKDQQITELQSQIRELSKRPLKPTNSKSTQTSDSELTNTLDILIKDIQDLNNSLQND